CSACWRPPPNWSMPSALQKSRDLPGHAVVGLGHEHFIRDTGASYLLLVRPVDRALKEVSDELRARLWHIVHESLARSRVGRRYAEASLRKPWSKVLYGKHVFPDHLMADEFVNSFEDLAGDLKQVSTQGTYVQLFGLLQWLLRERDCPISPTKCGGLY